MRRAGPGDRARADNLGMHPPSMGLGISLVSSHDSPILSPMLYFDHNATAPMLQAARDAWMEATDRIPGNPSSQHRVGARADTALQSARERLAVLLGCDPFDLIWTSGGTESNNQVLHHYAKALPKEGEVWVSDIEHPSILATA